MLGGRLHAQYPENDVKRYYTYRNRGYLLSQPGHAQAAAAGVVPVRLLLPRAAATATACASGCG